MSEVTCILSAIERGDLQAADQLLPVVYAELRRLAAQKLAQEEPGHTLQATALVHEAYLRLMGKAAEGRWAGSAGFFSAAAEAMRRILIDRARRKRSLRKGGDLKRRPLDHVEITIPELSLDILAINEVLERFEKLDPLKASLVKLRYFTGMTIPEVAAALNISSSTADRYWAYARAWLHGELKNAGVDYLA